MASRKRAKTKCARHKSKTCRSTRKSTSVQVQESNARTFGRLQEWFLSDPEIFAGLALHGNTSWKAVDLMWLALCWAWSESRHVTDAFEQATEQCGRLGGVALSTYQGFMNALVTWTDSLMRPLWSVLHTHMQQIGGRLFEINGWVPIAFDGSRSSVARSESNEAAFCAANYGQGKTARYRKKKTKGMRRRQNEKHKPQPPQPQVWITMMWHMGLRLPWMWRLGPSNASERAHVKEMIDDGNFPGNTLFCGDAGFVGYPLWSQIVNCGFDFLVRVGANVKLLTESGCHLGQDGRVLAWPQHAQRSGLPPLQLRLVTIKIGKTNMHMLTSVLQGHRLSRAEMVRLYKLRWGIEVEFRGLKQTLNRSKLRCRNHDRVLIELNWSIMAMAVAELFALKEQVRPFRKTTNADASASAPRKRSLANTMRALRRCLTNLGETPATGGDLQTQLRHAVTDDYCRKSPKTARYRPPNPDKKPFGGPKLRKLNKTEQTNLDAIRTQKAAA